MSLFTKLLNLYQGNKPLEDFFTEIVAYYFERNKEILLTWLTENLVINQVDFYCINILTQQEYAKLPHHPINSRPDFVVELGKEETTDLIFIESKIGSVEGWEQLKRYAEILSSFKNLSKRHLIYITRDYDEKDEFKKSVIDLSPPVNFVQLRWYQFYGFLQKQKSDILAQEILVFMENYSMSTKQQLLSIDLLTMMNFNKTLNFMQETLSGKVKYKFAESFGNVPGPATSLTQWRWQSRYIIYTLLSGWNFSCGLGYFSLNPERLVEYPTLGIYLEVSSGFHARSKIIESMQKVVNDHSEIWQGYALTLTPAWSRISYTKSLQSFMSQEDHLSSIQDFFLTSIDELKKIQHYFNFPWKGGVVEDNSEESTEGEGLELE